MFDLTQVVAHPFEQHGVRDVSRGHVEKAARSSGEEMAISEVAVLGHDDPVVMDDGDLFAGSLGADDVRGLFA